MFALPADCRKIVQVAATLAAALVAISACRIPAQAQQTAGQIAKTNHMLVVPANDGYGFEDCLGANKACGRTIADAWCEAHGMSASLSFGRAEDVTASIKSATTPAKLQPGSFIVNCKD